MEVIKSFTGVWHVPVFGTFAKEVKETISVIHCDTLYIVVRVTDQMEEGSSVPIETKHTRDYTKALDWYEEWNEVLMWNMTRR